MNFSWYFSRRTIFKSHRSISNLVIRLAVLSIAIGLAVMEISISIVNGFEDEIRDKVIGFGSHIQITRYMAGTENEARPIPIGSPFVPAVQALPEVKAVEPYVMMTAMLQTQEDFEGVLLKGVDEDYEWSFFKEHLVEGRLPDYQAEKETREILISRKLGKLLQTEAGDTARLYFMTDPPRRRSVVITGIYETGMEEFDVLHVFAHILTLQKMKRWEAGTAEGFEVILHSLETLDESQMEINDLIGYKYSAQSITQLYPDIFDWLELQHSNVYFIIALMTILAVVTMTSVILILILENTRTIGLLKSLGMTSGRIIGIFVWNAFFLVLAGVILGNIFGLGLILSQNLWHWVPLSQESYFVTEVPVSFEWMKFLVINIFVIIVCTIMMTVPALLSARITPVKALRFD